MQINKEINMKKIIKISVFLIFLFGLFCCVLSVFRFDTEQKVASINEFLCSHYCFFLVMRLTIYCLACFILFKFKKTIMTKIKTEKQKTYNKFFFRASILCFVLIFFNEMMLIVRLMG